MADRKWWLRSLLAPKAVAPAGRARLGLDALEGREVPAVITWTGGAGAAAPQWSNDANWDLGRAPVAGDDLVFDYSVSFITNRTTINDLPADTAYNSFTSFSNYSFSGNSIVLTGGGMTFDGLISSGNINVAIPVTFSTAAQTIRYQNNDVLTDVIFSPSATVTLNNVDLTLQNNDNFSNFFSDGTLTIQSRITGVGNLLIDGDDDSFNSSNFFADSVTLAPQASSNDYIGDTTVIGGDVSLAPGAPGINAIPGNFFIGDDNAANGRAVVVLRTSEAIADTSSVSIAGDGQLDLTFLGAGTVETIGDLSLGSATGGGKVISFAAFETLAVNGDVTVTAAPTSSVIESNLDFIGPGTHTINVLGGSATVRTLTISGGIGAETGATVRHTGSGPTSTIELQGRGRNGDYNTEVVGAGLYLNTFVSINSTIPAALRIGDASGVASSVVLLDRDQINDVAVVTFGPGGTLDFSNLLPSTSTVNGKTTTTFGQETIGGLSGGDSTSLVQFGTSAATLTIQPAGVLQYDGNVNGDGIISIGAPQGNPSAPVQIFTGNLQLTGFSTTTGLYSVQAGGASIDIRGRVFGGGGGVNSGFLGNGTIYGTGTVRALQTNTFGGINPGTSPNPDAADILAANNPNDPNIPLVRFGVPGTLTTTSLDLDGPLTIRIASDTQFGQIRVLGDVGQLGAFSSLRIDLPYGFRPQSGQVYRIIDVVDPTQRFNVLSTTLFGGLTEGSIVTDSSFQTQFLLSFSGGDGNDVVLIETSAPLPTITLDPSQATPTAGSTATFLVTFNGPVTGILPTAPTVVTSGDVTFNGTVINRISDTVFQVIVTGIRGTGTVQLSLPQGAAFSFAGTPSQPSLDVNNIVTIVGATGTGGAGLVLPGDQGFVPPLPRTPATRFLVGADAGGGGAVNVYQSSGTPAVSFSLPSALYNNGVRVATGDFNRDGVKDYVFATGPGGPNLVQVYDGVTGALLFGTQPFEESYTGGINVTAGDLTGDGTPELVVAPDVGGGPRVQVYNGSNFLKIADFFGIDDLNFRGGVRVAVGDVNRDGVGDLIVAAGFGGGPRVAIFDGRTIGASRPTRVTADFFAFEQSLRNGVTVASLDVNEDGFFDVVTGGGPGGGPRVQVFSGKSLLVGQLTPLANFFAGDVNSRAGVRVAATDYNGDGSLELVVGDAPGDGSTVQVFRPINIRLPNPVAEETFEAFENFGGGVWVG